MPEREIYATKHKTLSFNYVWNKAGLLEAWLLARGELPRQRLFSNHYGTAAGYEVYKTLVAQVEGHCGQWGVECTAMLHPALMAVEGHYVRIDWPNGKHSTGRVIREGRAIKFHRIVKDGNRYGAKIDPWHFEGAAVETIGGQ